MLGSVHKSVLRITKETFSKLLVLLVREAIFFLPYEEVLCIHWVLFAISSPVSN